MDGSTAHLLMLFVEMYLAKITALALVDVLEDIVGVTLEGLEVIAQVVVLTIVFCA